MKIFLLWIYLDAEMFYLIREGKLSVYFLIMVGSIISTVQILIIYYPVYEAVILILKRFFIQQDNGTTEFGKKLWKWLKKWKGSSMARKWARRWNKLKKYKYQIIFLLNIIPFLPVITTSTVIAVRLSKHKKITIVMVILGNVAKFFIFVPLLHYLLWAVK